MFLHPCLQRLGLALLSSCKVESSYEHEQEMAVVEYMFVQVSRCLPLLKRVIKLSVKKQHLVHTVILLSLILQYINELRNFLRY